LKLSLLTCNLDGYYNYGRHDWHRDDNDVDHVNECNGVKWF